MSQLSFEFTSAEDATPQDGLPETVAGLTLEEMAQRLQAHPDYRVLRRLVPVTDYGPPPDAHGAMRPSLRVLILDTETTGLSHASDRIIELAMLLVQVDVATGRPFGPVESFEGFEDPGMPIPEVARQVTGIDDDMVRGHRLDDALVLGLLERADLVVAHNAGFDRPFLEARFPAFAGKPWACSFADIDWKSLGAESAKLGALAQDRGWFYDAHRALVDCHALLQVLCAGDGGEGDAASGMGRLLQAAQRPTCKLRATGSPFDSKDALKGRGYRWDADARVWFCSLTDEDALQAELAWLRSAVYGQRRAQVEVERLDALTRYSARSGLVENRDLPLP